MEDFINIGKKEYLWFCNTTGYSSPEIWKLRELERIEDDVFITYNSYTETYACYYFAIRLQDFDPYDMEKSRKHALCVKNGRIIRDE